VAIIDDLSAGKRENLSAGARFYEADIRSECGCIFEEFEREVLFHHAAQIDVRRSVREPDFGAVVNILGTLRLLQNCVGHGVHRVVFSSSVGAVYGEPEEFPATEDHPQYPVSPYGVAKLAGERYLNFYSAHYNLPCVALRFANVYGPRQDPYGKGVVVAIFSANLAANKGSTINGKGEQTRDYVYVGDVARANVLALEGDPPLGAYNIGTGVETNVNRLYELVGHIGKEPPTGQVRTGQAR
jgi:UDP-glucose 4-epimerase